MKTVRKDWHTAPDGSLTLELSVEVNGERFAVRQCTDPHGMSMRCPVPFAYIERDMRRKLMLTIEDKLLGPMR